MNKHTMISKVDPTLEQAYQFCLHLTHNHYENFPVASLLLPKQLRRPISVIYAFARTADDIADEGDVETSQRKEQLKQYHLALEAIQHKLYLGKDPIFIALEDVIHHYRLPISLFFDLLSAFEQDIEKNRYQCRQDIYDYCHRSANPIGRLLLYLSGNPTQQQLDQSDALCTALQLINFFQDIEQDLIENNRLYLPQQDVNEATVIQSITSNNTTQLAPSLRCYYQQTRQLLAESHTLTAEIKGRLAWEIRAISLSGLIILKLLSQQADDNMLSRPRLTKWQLLQASTMSISNYLYSKFAYKLQTQITIANSQ